MKHTRAPKVLGSILVAEWPFTADMTICVCRPFTADGPLLPLGLGTWVPLVLPFHVLS
jgi:hypothetical protein